MKELRKYLLLMPIMIVFMFLLPILLQAADLSSPITVINAYSPSSKQVKIEWSESKTAKIKYSKWDKLLDKYEKSDSTNQLVFVKYTGKSLAEVEFYEKRDGHFELVLTDEAYIGRKGIGKTREGDEKTPEGTYKLTKAFGIKKNPGTKIKYTKLNKNHWWCSDKNYYNQLINIKKKPHECKGEHLIKYGRAYNYCLFIDYNKECKYPKGSAIFLHCKDNDKNTSGCIAIDEANMISILQAVEDGAKICIYSK